MAEKRLRALYKKHVEGKYFYRTFSNEYVKTIKKEGFNPRKNPYETQTKNITYFCKMLDRFENQGYYYTYMHWPLSKPIGSILSRVFRKSLRKKYMDLTPNTFNDLHYYEKRQGGDIPLTIHHVCKDIITWNYPLTTRDKQVVRSLQRWAAKRIRFKNTTVNIKATDVCLEKAEVQRFYGKAYLPSPFGSFENFCKHMTKHTYRTYKPLLEGKEQYYLRFRHRIPPEHIRFR